VGGFLNSEGVGHRFVMNDGTFKTVDFAGAAGPLRIVSC
jgi:hypothetical protein